MGIEDLLKDKRVKILQIATKYGAHNVRVIGSVARGEAGPESDVDFLVDLDPECSLLDHAALMNELTVFLGRKVDVVTERGMHPNIRDQVIHDAVSL